MLIEDFARRLDNYILYNYKLEVQRPFGHNIKRHPKTITRDNPKTQPNTKTQVNYHIPCILGILHFTQLFYRQK